MRLSNAMTHFNFCSPLRPSLRIKPPFMSAFRWGILEFLLATGDFILHS